MKAMLSVEVGGPEKLVVEDLPMPDPGAGEVRIAVKAAGVNFPDTLIIRDKYQFRPERPFAPGSEVSGVIDAVGDGVSSSKLGDRVITTPLYGGFCTHLIAKDNEVIRIPDQLPFDEAAGFIFTYGTAYYALKDCAGIRRGDTVLVIGASGGVGSAAVELAKALGGEVIAAVSSTEKALFCESIGADHTLVYPVELTKDRQKAFAKEIKYVAGEKSVQIVCDVVGGNYAEPAMRTLAWHGRYLVIGFPAGIPTIPLNIPLLKGCRIVGVFWGAAVQRDFAAHKQNVGEILELYIAGQIRPRITTRYSLDRAAEALLDIEERRAKGKLIITME